MSYIGNQPVLNTSEFREEFAVTSTQTVFNTGGFTASSDSATLEVLRNGVLLGTADYTLGSDASTVTLANAAVNGDIIVIKGRRELTNGVQVTERRHEHTIASGETTVTFPYPLTTSQTDVYLNGVKLGSSDFSINSSTRVVSFTTNPAVGDLVAIVSREPALTANSSLPVVDAAGNNVLSESGGTVTVTADQANVGSNALVVNSSGNVGVGTSSPSAKLETVVSDDTTTSGLRTNQLSLTNSFSATGSTGASANLYFSIVNGNTFHQAGISAIDTGGNSTFATDMAFFTRPSVGGAPAERMRIDSSGNLLVGKESASTNTVGVEARPDGTFAAVKSAGGAAVFGRNTNDGTIVSFRKDGTNVGTISTTANSLPSDRNFKKDIYELEFGLDLVKKLKPKTYRYKINDDNSPFMIGFVAQDLEESLLEVGVNQNECWILQHNENVEDGNSAYQLDYSRLIPILAKAIQEQQAIIEFQQSQIDALTARIEALEATP